MATEVYTTEVIILLDETEVELRPLPISKLRKFTRIWSDHITTVQAKLKAAVEAEESEDGTEAVEEFSSQDLTDAQYDVFVKLCAFGLESQLKGDKTDKQFAAYLEDVLDEATIYRILDRTGNLKLGPEQDPNLQSPATALGAAGTN